MEVADRALKRIKSSDAQSDKSLLDLPVDILASIIEMTSCRDIVAVSQTCKLLCTIASGNDIWQPIYHRDWRHQLADFSSTPAKRAYVLQTAYGWRERGGAVSKSLHTEINNFDYEGGITVPAGGGRFFISGAGQVWQYEYPADVPMPASADDESDEEAEEDAEENPFIVSNVYRSDMPTVSGLHYHDGDRLLYVMPGHNAEGPVVIQDGSWTVLHRIKLWAAGSQGSDPSQVTNYRRVGMAQCHDFVTWYDRETCTHITNLGYISNTPHVCMKDDDVSLFSGNEAQPLVLFDLRTKLPTFAESEITDAGCISMKDDNTAVVSEMGGSVFLVDLRKAVRTLKPELSLDLDQQELHAMCANEWLVAAGCHHGSVKVVNYSQTYENYSYDLDPEDEYVTDSCVRALQFVPEGGYVSLHDSGDVVLRRLKPMQ
eukprot:TRINITY_DN2108_c0_g1_i1.p1 TRINITY_DN2108_c0_g1~~TRINITY_DN2108_c0_g1_i1.p1  ORF type:complete len:430 (+),score=72.48 TRINITY_DN2108_c0_g1_i1:88-1377(+)